MKILRSYPQIPIILDGPPGISIVVISGYIDRIGRPIEPKRIDRVSVPVDYADDLSREPMGWIQPTSINENGVHDTWIVCGVGFIEDDALAAYAAASREALS